MINVVAPPNYKLFIKQNLEHLTSKQLQMAAEIIKEHSQVSD